MQRVPAPSHPEPSGESPSASNPRRRAPGGCFVSPATSQVCLERSLRRVSARLLSPIWLERGRVTSAQRRPPQWRDEAGAAVCRVQASKARGEEHSSGLSSLTLRVRLSGIIGAACPRSPCLPKDRGLSGDAPQHDTAAPASISEAGAARPGTRRPRCSSRVVSTRRSSRRSWATRPSRLRGVTSTSARRSHARRWKTLRSSSD